MAIRRWDPMREFEELRERMNRLFEEVRTRAPENGGFEFGEHEGWQPPMDLFEERDRYVMRVDVPGVPAGGLTVAVEDGVLLLRGERPQDESVPGDAYLRSERPHGRFSVQLTLPDGVEAAKITALHKGGVIEIALPKKREEPGGGQIQVAVE